MHGMPRPDPASYDSFLALDPAGGFTDIWIDPSSRSIYSTIPYCAQVIFDMIESTITLEWKT